VAYASVQRSFDHLTSFITGPATLRVRGPLDQAGLDEATVARLEAVDGVATVVPLVTTVVQVGDPADPGTERMIVALGADCSIEAVVGEVGCTPELIDLASSADLPLVSERLAGQIDPGAVVYTDAGPVPLDQASATSVLDEVNDGQVIAWPLASAQRLLGREGLLDYALVVPAPGADAARLRDDVEAAAGAHNVVEDAHAPLRQTFVTNQLLPGLALTSLVGLVMGLQLVSATFSLAFEERRREIALAAAVGASPRFATRGIMAEAVLLGAAGGALGVLGAALVGGAFVSTLATQVERISGLRLGVAVPLWVGLAGVAMGVLLALIAAARTARAAARLDLAAELSERERHDPEPRHRRRSLAIAMAGSMVGLFLGWLGWRGGTLEPWQPLAALVGVVLGGTCAFRLPGLLAADAVRLLSRVPVTQRGHTGVAIANLRGDPIRAAAIANALGVAAALAVTLGAVVTGIGETARRDARESSGGHVTISVLGVNNTSRIDSKLSPSQIDAVAAVPGVARVSGLRFTAIDHPSVGSISIVSNGGLDAPNNHVYRGKGRAEAFADGAVMIGPALARRHGLEPGDALTLPGVRGPVELTVGGVWASAENVGSSVFVSAAQFEALAGPRPASMALVAPEPGAGLLELERRIAASGIDPRLEAFAPATLGMELAEEIEGFVGPFRALQRAMLVVAFVATLSNLLLSAVQRRRELATLAAVGMPPRDLARMALIEAIVLGTVATALGAAGGVVGYVAFVFLSPSVTGLPMAWTVPGAGLPATFAIVVLVALAGAAWPAWRSTRVEPALALRYE
jgi:putative ABC transport system permease protein